MGGKARIHELAKELGVPSREILERLKAQGEFVKSASSTVKAPVARRLRQSFGSIPQGQGVPSGDAKSRKPGATVAQNEAEARRAKQRTSPVERADAALSRGNRQPRSPVSNQRVVRPVLRRQVRKEQAKRSANTGTKQQPPEMSPSPYVVHRPRARRSGLPQVVVNLDVEAVADIVASDAANDDDSEAIATRLHEIAPSGPGGYGYLTWRFAATRSSGSEARLGTAHEDLVALAIFIEHERQLLKDLVRAHGSMLTKPNLAEVGLRKEFKDHLDADAAGTSAADELRRTRASFNFLRRAVLLTVASSGSDQQLWEILDRIRPPSIDRLPETSPQLERAIRRLIGFIAAVAELLSTDDANLAGFFRDSRRQLIALQLKRYDFLRRYRDGVTGLERVSRQTTDLEFEILPQGDQLRAFLGEIRRSKTYSGYRVDELSMST